MLKKNELKKIDREVKNTFFGELNVLFLMSRLLIDLFVVTVLIITIKMIMELF